MDVSLFDYELPPELIAQTPLEPRHASRLMIVNRQTGQITHHTFTGIVNLLYPGDILIANDSRVIPARLFGHKTSGGKVEILLLKQIDPLRWEALVGGKRLRPGVVVEIEEARSGGAEEQGSRGAEEAEKRGTEESRSIESSMAEEVESITFSLRLAASSPPRLFVTILKDLGDSRRLIEFSHPINPHLPDVGHVPLPPYIHTKLSDAERYQTVFSRIDGSAAAPTAGLHFTPEILLQLRQKDVQLDYVTLHIGLDTFKPVTVDRVEAHAIHRERAALTPETAKRINEAKLAGGRLVAVGTTAVRTLETAALRSAGYEGSLRRVSAEIGEEVTCPWRPVVAIDEETDLYLYPGYTFRVVDVMLTNFHLPKSTLLMLVSAFAGWELIQRAYAAAIAEKYRFYSFGDAMLIL